MSFTALGSQGVCCSFRLCLPRLSAVSHSRFLWLLTCTFDSKLTNALGSPVLILFFFFFSQSSDCREQYSSSQSCCRIWSLCTSWILSPSHLYMPSKSCRGSTALRSRVPGQPQAMSPSGLSYCMELNSSNFSSTMNSGLKMLQEG